MVLQLRDSVVPHAAERDNEWCDRSRDNDRIIGLLASPAHGFFPKEDGTCSRINE
jgi:hypothetical protein